MEKMTKKTPESAPSKFPELARAQEIREKGEFDYKPSASLWYWNMVDEIPFDTDTKAKMLLAQKQEPPYLVSAVMERTCNLQCAHCLYKAEKSSTKESEAHGFNNTVEHIVSNMPPASDDYHAKFMSAGRILRPEHLKLFTRLREARPDVGLGVIDNGTFTKLLPTWPKDFKFDWIDISIDGSPAHHNEQRGSARAYADAMEGLAHAREVTRSPEEGGYVSSLLTLSNINARDVQEVANTLLIAQESGVPLVDVLKLTTLSPTNEINAGLEMSVDDFARAWEGLKEINKAFNIPGQDPRVTLGIYRMEDIEKLAQVVGEKKFMESFPQDESLAGARVNVQGNFLNFNIDGVPVSYLPLSIWPPEEFLIEADAAYRVAYEGQFTLDELQSGRSTDGKDTSAFTVAQLSPESDFMSSFEKAVDHYWQNFGAKHLEAEFATFQRIKAKANLG